MPLSPSCAPCSLTLGIMLNLVTVNSMFSLAAMTACVTLVAIIACLGGPSVSRSDMLQSVVPNVVVPLHETAADALQILSEVTRDACSDASRLDVDKIRAAWRVARSAVSRSRAVEFGPAADRHASSLIDWDALDTERVGKLLAVGQTLTANSVREFTPATARGLRAIEYLVFDDVPLDDSRCNYLSAISEAAADEARAVVDEWTGSGTASGNEPYADVFSGYASSSLLPLAAVTDIISTSIFLIRSIVDMQLGNALGIDGKAADWTAIGEGLSRNGVADLRDAIVGMRAVYLGSTLGVPAIGNNESGRFGIGDLVAGAAEEADVRVGIAFDAAISSIDALAARADSLTSLIANNRGAVMHCYLALKELQLTLNTEVVSLLGISVGFADTDGDSG